MSALAKLDRPMDQARRAATLLLFVAPILTRVVIGWAFYETGHGKLQNPERTVAFFASLGLPLPEFGAAFVSRLEYYGGLLLVVGLFTRVVAALLSSTMVVALLTAHREEVLGVLKRLEDAPGVMDIAPLPFLIALVWLIGFGPGPISLDRLLFRRWSKSPESAA
jgi:putative oxidoreductase